MPNSLEKSAQDKKDLERFSKFFAYKVVQVIVQSRLGEKIRCNSRSTSLSSDWFNLCIEDNPEILKHTKAALGSNSLPSPPLLVEISLKPTDSEPLPIELWNLHFDEFDAEQNVRILFTVYNRMSLLLKSLISVSRVVPAYKYSRMKGSDYQILYNVMAGEPDYNRLGRECKIIKLGAVGTPFGSICLEFGYRTKMALSIESRPMNPVLIKSNHYSVDDSINGPEVQDPFKPIPLPKIPAFSDPLTLPSEELDPLDIPFGSLLRRSIPARSPREDSPQMIIEEQEVSSSASESDAMNMGGGAFEFVNIQRVKPIPFANVSDPASDPASFFSTLQNPPPLESFESLPPTPVSEIDRQLDSFEENLGVFDEFVRNLCLED
jgi:autophagy-related protein 13